MSQTIQDFIREKGHLFTDHQKAILGIVAKHPNGISRNRIAAIQYYGTHAYSWQSPADVKSAQRAAVSNALSCAKDRGAPIILVKISEVDDRNEMTKSKLIDYDEDCVWKAKTVEPEITEEAEPEVLNTRHVRVALSVEGRMIGTLTWPKEKTEFISSRGSISAAEIAFVQETIEKLNKTFG